MTRKVIIAGGRHYQLTGQDYKLLDEALEAGEISEVVCGGASGADECGRQWAIRCGLPVKVFNARWDEHGRAAGPMRNRQMAKYADALIAFWDGKSRGTANMILEAEARSLQVSVYINGVKL